jgi:LCP family protein required for cell wall assembly
LQEFLKLSRIYLIRENREGCKLADKNTDSGSEKNNKHKKKIKWISVLFILFLIIFIGSAGYYLESGLRPIDDNEYDSSQQNNGGNGNNSLLDRVMGILNLNDSEFSQNMDILFVGLDDKDIVAVGEIEADSIMLARLRPEESYLYLENIDENTRYQEKSLRKYHDGNVAKAVENIKNTEFDHYVYLHYQGFEKVIDELGGVKINLSDKLQIPALGLNLKAGDNLLSGKEALNFVRLNDGSEDSRLQRQKQLINAVIEKVRGNNFLFNVRDLYNTVVNSYNSIETDIEPVLAVELFNYFKGNTSINIEFIE